MKRKLLNYLVAIVLSAHAAVAVATNIKHPIDTELEGAGLQYDLSSAVVIGDAFDVNGEALLYREFHIRRDEREHVVVYQNSSGAIIAHKEIDYQKSQIRPAINQSNYLVGENIVVTSMDDGENLRVSYQPRFGSDEKSKVLEAAEELVVDAGFHPFIQRNWNELLASQKIAFYFLSPSRLTRYKFSLQGIDCSDGLRVDASGDHECFEIEPANPFLRLLVRPIQLLYDGETKELLRFKGLGNLADETGEYMTVDIRYRNNPIE